jgi:hypothetical protein
MAKIIFHPSLEETVSNVPSPKPASSYKEDWYDKISAFYQMDDLYSEDYMENLTLKHCLPFRDSLQAGYIQETWQDVSFTLEDEGMLRYVFPISPDIIGHRDRSSLPMGSEFHKTEFVFKMPWAPHTPPGWSVIVTQPFNRPGSPFFVPSAIIDSDLLNYSMGQANVPFYLKKDAPRLIKSGTPMYQIIPFKRENWVSETREFDAKAQRTLVSKLRKHFWGGYKKYIWQKKSYL